MNIMQGTRPTNILSTIIRLEGPEGIYQTNDINLYSLTCKRCINMIMVQILQKSIEF